MTDLVVLDGLDWDHFIESYWDRRPVLFKGVSPAPFTEDAVLASAIRSQHGMSEDAMSPGTRLTIEQWQQTAHRGLVPTGQDKSFAGYEQRMATRLGGRRYALLINGMHAYDRSLWDQERRFFRPLWEHVGLPLAGAITMLFHGTYEHSPVGVHRDRFASFVYGLRGRKRMRFWSQRPWQQSVTTVVDYAEYLRDSFAAEIEPGDLLYWPVRYYHVGETVGSEPSTTVNVGVPWELHTVGEELDDLLVDLDSATLADETSTSRMPSIDAPLFAPGADTDDVLAPDLPVSFERALDILRDAGSDDRLVTVSLRHWTAASFEPVPEPEPVRPLSDDDLVRCVEIEISGNICAVNGHTARAPANRRLLDLLHSKQPLRVGDLPGEARPFLEWLESVGGIIRTDASYRTTTVDNLSGGLDAK